MIRLDSLFLVLLEFLVIILFASLFGQTLEFFSPYYYGRGTSRYQLPGGWPINISTRWTRNQSYDLRGDPYVIPVNPYLSPWGMSSWWY